MSQITQVTIDAMYGEQAALESQLAAVINNVPRDVVEQQKVEALIQDKKTEIQAAEKELREQGKQATVDNYVDTLSQMFEAFLPSETFRPLFGLNAYEEKRAQFYQLSQAYTGEAIETQHQKNEELLAAKDERIKALSAQSLAVQQQLDEAKHDLQEYIEHNQTLSDDVSDRNQQIAEYSINLDNANKIIEGLNQEIKLKDGFITKFQEKIMDLELRLETAQQPKEEVKPSAKVTDLINQIKSKNDIAPDDFIARWNARQKDESVKLEVPEVPQQELPFQDKDSTTQPNGNQLLYPEATSVEGPIFPTATAPDVQGVSVAMAETASGGSGASGETPITTSQLESRLAEFRKDIMTEIMGEKVA